MNVTVEKLDDINIILSGEVDKKEIEANVAKLEAADTKKKEETKKELDKEMKDDAPVGEELDMVHDVLNNMGSKNYEKDAEGMILQEFIETGLKVANIPVEEILGQPGFKTYEQRENGLYLEIQISTAPEVNTDVDYSDIIPTFTTPEAPQNEVEAKLKEMAIQQAPFTTIPEPKAVENGDVTVIDFEGFVDGVAFEGGKAEKFNLKIGSNSFIPGFEEQLIGMNYNEEKSITVTFPADYSSADLAGKESVFNVKLHEIQEQQYVAPDDAFAQKILNDETATLDTLKSKLADQINSQALSAFYQNELKPILIKGLLTKFDFTLPANVVEQEIDAKVNERAQNMGREEHEQYKENKDMFQQLRLKVREDAENTIKIALIVDALAKKENINVDEHEIQAALYYQAMMTGQDAEELVKYYKEHNLMTSAKMGLTEDKLFGMMLGFDKK
ncbi:MAG: Cell division trigger factor (EC [uncultured Sulfurovum sp.]|uniref:Trigger factor n=1 Tax=uncultured Sulfurovum sp. TaxID=269237 RepID=A0A6S6TLW5_9BACT|nr:MAG: Cell division trigger factor (EC [uncultured Sulfurovum sp.]